VTVSTGAPTVGEVLRDGIVASLATMRREEPGVRAGDPGAVHRFRVCVRHLRSVLGILAEVLDESTVRFLRDELRRLGDASNAVRDLDVLGATLHREICRLDPDDAPAVASLLRTLDAQTASARRSVVDALDDPGTASLLAALERIATLSPGLLAAADGDERAARRRIRSSVRRRGRALHRHARTLGADPPVAALHRLRLLAKRYRYSLLALGPLAGAGSQRLARALAGLQDELGLVHDASVAEQWLRDTATAMPDAALVAGQLVAHVRRDEPHRWAKALRRVEAAERRSWLA
jgi:CHAD domain-containing protein